MKLLAWCSYFGDVTACRLLLARGQLLSALGADFGLNAAAFHGHWQLCEFLIESGANARYADPETGETPLHSALTNEDRVRYDSCARRPTDVLRPLLYGPHNIRADHQPMRANLSGTPTE